MLPRVIATVQALLWGRRDISVTTEPVGNNVVVKLLCPKQARVRLPRNDPFLMIAIGRNDRFIKFVGLCDPLSERLFEACTKGCFRIIACLTESCLNRATLPSFYFKVIKICDLRSVLVRIYSVMLPMNDVPMECVFDVRSRRVRSVESYRIRFVFGK